MQNQTKQELELVEQEIQTLSEELDKMANSLEVIRRRLHNAKVIEKALDKDEEAPKSGWEPAPVDIIHCAPYLHKDGTVVFERGGKLIIVPSTVVQKAMAATTLVGFFKAFGLDVEDKRAKEGALWLHGNKEMIYPSSKWRRASSASKAGTRTAACPSAITTAGSRTAANKRTPRGGGRT